MFIDTMFIDKGPQRPKQALTAAWRALLVLALTLFCSAPTSCASHSQSDTGPIALDGGNPQKTIVTIADLAAAGLSVFADPTQTQPMVPVTTQIGPTPVRLLKDQADAILLEADWGQGMLGADIDALIPSGDGMPPASYFLAGYVVAAGTPGAALARRVMGTQDWKHAPSVVFPTLVFALFAADAARFANAVADAQATGSSTQSFAGPQASGATAQGLTFGTLCSDTQNFINSTISAIFDAIGHLQSPKIPQSGIGIIDLFTSGVQKALDLATGVVNGLIAAGEVVVVNGVKFFTQPVLNAIAAVAAPIAVAAQIVSFLRPWTVAVSAAPPQIHKPVEPASGAPGTLTVTVTLPGGFDDWPPIIADCAQAAGIALPPLKPAGAPVVWTLMQNPPALVIQNADTPSVLDSNASASLGYRTTTETARDARGIASVGIVQADAAIQRKEVSDLQKTVSDALFSQVPSLLQPFLKQLLGPAIAKILNLPAELLDAHGRGPLEVDFDQCQEGDCCPAGQIACEPVCIDPNSDPANCGGCGIACASGCQGGTCIGKPPPGGNTKVWVHVERAAAPPMLAGRVLELEGCSGKVGPWAGFMRLGGLDDGQGFTVAWASLPVAFTVTAEGVPVHTTVTGDVPTPVYTLHVTYALDVTVTGNIMSITGNATGNNGMFELNTALPGLDALTIAPAPASACP